RYGSIFSYSVPGRYPSRSPASTAGLVRLWRVPCLLCSACTALPMARYVFPVPAGPTPNTTVYWSMASTYRFWFNVLGRIVRPRRDKTFMLRTSAGESELPDESMVTVRRTVSGLTCWPRDHALVGEFRSEEHRSELQSRENIVCRLLLE